MPRSLSRIHFHGLVEFPRPSLDFSDIPSALMVPFICRLPPFAFVLFMTLLVHCSVGNAMDMVDMPDDPISGKMVMSHSYNLELNNGQKLRFANQETLDSFLQDPKTGLQGVASVPVSPNHRKEERKVLCPICGMESTVSYGPAVVMRHGDQVVHTCSLTHARQVYEHILSFQAAKADSDAYIEDHGFCTGPGTTMLNGFSPSGHSTPCILLWFPGWVLNSRLRYHLGGIFVVLIAVLNEYLLQLRRVLRKESSAKRLMRCCAPQATESAQLLRSPAPNMLLHGSCGPAWFRQLSAEVQHGVHSLLHGITLFVAYMLMLVSMTYDFTLLLWVITGYVLGYYIFGERREVSHCGEWRQNKCG
ncbi:hypothetical protein CCR75_002613 [Bremia lactucae]|uniref:Copper transport protein n=1 Tax=Bremia lactucae TaxID=4779 RepID=A0A976IKZ0_BRELC|nr:hypothetical protein CCR75_002613 [Bremia lactucae]